jgi:predicted membrane channel-forming protein YqfA (hemolysin III family)
MAFGTPNRQTLFYQKNFWIVAEVIVARGLASIHFENTPPLPQRILNFLALVEVCLINLDPTFAMARWAGLAELKTKVVFYL